MPMKAFIVKRALYLTPGAILDELTKSPEFPDLNWKNKPCEWAIRRLIIDLIIDSLLMLEIKEGGRFERYKDKLKQIIRKNN